ncbi:hypothetical protein HY413_02960 [Candidatus Kaiserbacteria bacterium]|nr:hypothetical protein [Candidatus Kaiserbacteria bacterium]
MKSITSDGKKYLPALEAGKLIGVSRDYIGRLCRQGIVHGKRIGTFWIVEENSLKNYAYSAVKAKIERRESLVRARTAAYSAQKVFRDGVQASQKQETRIPDNKLASLSTWHVEKHAASALNFFHTQSRSPITFSATAQMIPPSTAHQLTDLLHKIISLIMIFILVFGSYAVIDHRFASFARETFSKTRMAIMNAPYILVNGLDAVAIASRSQQLASTVSSDVISFSDEHFSNAITEAARAVHSAVDTVVTTVLSGIRDTESVVEVEIVPLEVHQ